MYTVRTKNYTYAILNYNIIYNFTIAIAIAIAMSHLFKFRSLKDKICENYFLSYTVPGVCVCVCINFSQGRFFYYRSR